MLELAGSHDPSQQSITNLSLCPHTYPRTTCSYNAVVEYTLYWSCPVCGPHQWSRTFSRTLKKRQNSTEISFFLFYERKVWPCSCLNESEASNAMLEWTDTACGCCVVYKLLKQWQVETDCSMVVISAWGTYAQVWTHMPWYEHTNAHHHIHRTLKTAFQKNY